MLTHKGNEYHIIHHLNMAADVTIAYRDIESSYIELLKIAKFSDDEEPRIYLFQLPTWVMKDILAHQEYRAEVEAMDGQQELMFEDREAVSA